jgi:hypothetical protein
MATVKQENPVNNDVNHLFQKIENLQIALKASSDAYQSAREQAKKDRRKYQNEVDRICEAANLKEFQLLEKIKQYEDQEQQDQEQQTLPTGLHATPQPVKNIDTVSTQTEQDEVILSNQAKISKLEMDLLKLDHNQDLLLSELNLQKKNNVTLQADITIMTKRMAKVTYANNLYHVSLIEHNCTLPEEAEHLISSLFCGKQAEDLQTSSSKSIIEHSEKQDAICFDV